MAVYREMSATSSAVKLDYLNHKEFICKLVSKRKHTAVFKSSNATLTETTSLTDLANILHPVES